MNTEPKLPKRPVYIAITVISIFVFVFMLTLMFQIFRDTLIKPTPQDIQIAKDVFKELGVEAKNVEVPLVSRDVGLIYVWANLDEKDVKKLEVEAETPKDMPGCMEFALKEWTVGILPKGERFKVGIWYRGSQENVSKARQNYAEWAKGRELKAL